MICLNCCIDLNWISQGVNASVYYEDKIKVEAQNVGTIKVGKAPNRKGLIRIFFDLNEHNIITSKIIKDMKIILDILKPCL
jgi:hypothetical protein